MKTFLHTLLQPLLFLCLLLTGFAHSSALAQNVGIGTATPAQKLEVEGWIELGDETQGGAGPATEGSIRYNNALDIIEYYNGTAWVSLGGGNTLDEAYDEGGPGAGRIITADNGAVQVQGTDGLRATGTHGSGATAPNGAGTRFLWLPRASAIRAGAAANLAWDNANIGDYSAAFGRETRASGQYSFSAGNDNRAAGRSSVAFGELTTADGDYSIGMGFQTQANADFSFSAGFETIAGGNSSTALGENTNAIGLASTALGASTNANADYSTAIGRTITVNGINSFGVGLNNTPSTITQNNVMSVMGGNVGVGTTAPAERLEVTGNLLFSHPGSRTIKMEDVDDGDAPYTLSILGSNAEGGTGEPGGTVIVQAGDADGVKEGGGTLQLAGGDGAPRGPVLINRLGGGVAIRRNFALQDVHIAGTVRLDDLAGGGTQNVQVNNDGDLIVGGSGGGFWSDNGSNLYPNAGRWVAIGKGATAAAAPLDVQGNIQLSGGCGGGCSCRTLNIEDCSWGTDFIIDGSDGIGGFTADGGDIRLLAGNGESSANGGNIILDPGNGGAGNGYVGINTTGPNHMLSVNGDASKTGTLA